MKTHIVKIGRAALLSAGLALLAIGQAGAGAAAQGVVNTGYFGNVAIKGYDPVAYFTQSKAVLGDPGISAEWLGAEWHFASSQDRDLFIANPIRYAPQYGGHCADGVAYGENAPTINIDPTAWVVINDKLYLNYDPSAAKEFAGTEGFIGKADSNWLTYTVKAKSN
jgi:hypothetical protein